MFLLVFVILASVQKVYEIFRKTQDTTNKSYGWWVHLKPLSLVSEKGKTDGFNTRGINSLVCYFVSRGNSPDLPLIATPTVFLVAKMAGEPLPAYFFKQTWN